MEKEREREKAGKESELRGHAPPLLMLYDFKLISEPCWWKVHHEVKIDGWKMEARGLMVG